jgi:putative membrane protein
LLTTVDSHGRTVVLQQENLNPLNYLTVTGNEPVIIWAIVWALVGVGLVAGVELTANWLKKKHSKV